MDYQPPRTPPRPLLLLGKPGDALAALLRTPALRDCFVVATPETLTVEELMRALRPTAVLLEASEFYLEGRELSARLRACSGGSRVVFFDVDRSWALWMEAEFGEGRDLRIVPCDLERAGDALKDLLSGSGGARVTSETVAIPLESAG
ncbi:MAG TPA: hypothetical protein VNM14_02130 [Planctomycetota bacterium]|jgi:hypothetical protein|nr:hypothetical protein [Planctomycetota bacterium]